jgi:hypothetical protein
MEANMKDWTFVVCIGVAIALGGVALSQEKSTPPTASAAAAPTTNVRTNAVAAKGDSGFHVIGYLERQGEVIALKSGPNGPVYSVTGKDGKVRYENLSSEQLKAQAPELSEFLKTSVATGAGKERTTADVSVSRIW